jgi:CheY-like chemotaxis protein
MIMISGGPQTILLVEDNDDHAELILRSLRDLKFAQRIIRVSDGQEALDYIHREGNYRDPIQYPSPTVIFLDLRLPKVDGLEVLKVIKSNPNLHHIPVVILTSSDADDDILRSYDNYANSYVVKPADFRLFNAMMRDLGSYWLGYNATTVLS